MKDLNFVFLEKIVFKLQENLLLAPFVIPAMSTSHNDKFWHEKLCKKIVIFDPIEMGEQKKLFPGS